ncbi:thioredoxin o [Monoraphidium neglectum]|uniref:Thioredoxin o n=1 Tax=Monoraphidium neglectum TaxID=145388 RepID=A0A0D2MNW5_9CHLO|nr:thioredoxin o [Monoraphidium neglectum]KIZ04395.1 thioredoxin o [Monoraphidium neglectum]|eukprot:XP_013903414.1 thioredoxin o [Monoraphidium neglectum]
MRAPSVHCQARFLKVDIDNEQLQRTVMDHGITGVPTFAFYKGRQRAESFTGARVDLLKDTIKKLAGS